MEETPLRRNLTRFENSNQTMEDGESKTDFKISESGMQTQRMQSSLDKQRFD